MSNGSERCWEESGRTNRGAGSGAGIPKETWALITFLGYLVIVHLKHAKWLDNFGLAVGSVLGFLLVLMTWYGVNFVLGRGLHSYGFGSRGIVWIIYYLVFEALFLGWAVLLRLRVISRYTKEGHKLSF